MRTWQAMTGALLLLAGPVVSARAQDAGSPPADGQAADAQDAGDEASGEPSESQDSEARLLFQAGRTAFEDGRFEDALEHFQRSYELSHRPGHLYNIGSTLDRLGRDQEAIESFEAYLRASPDASNRNEVEARLRILRQQAADSGGGGERQSSGGHGLLIGAIATGGGAVALGGAALAFWLVGNGNYDDLKQSCGARGCTDAEIDDSGVKTDDLLTNVFLVSSGVALALSGVLLGLALTRDDEQEPAVSLRVGPGSLALSWRLP